MSTVLEQSEPNYILYLQIMSGVTLDELCTEVGVTLTQLDKPCTSEHIQDIALFLESWRIVASRLGLSDAEVEAAKINATSEEERRQKILATWKAKFAFKAKYRVLIETLLKIGRADQAEKVCRVLIPQQPTGGMCTYFRSQSLNVQVGFAHFNYSMLDHPTSPPEAVAITPPSFTHSTLGPLSNPSEQVSMPVSAPSVKVPAVDSPAAFPTDQLLQAGAKEVSVVRQEKDRVVSKYDKLVLLSSFNMHVTSDLLEIEEMMLQQASKKLEIELETMHPS